MKTLEMLAAEGCSVVQIAETLGITLDAAVTRLVRWLRRQGHADVTPWVDPLTAERVKTLLKQEVPPTMTAVALECGVAPWVVRIVSAALWNEQNPPETLPEIPLNAQQKPDLEAMLLAEWPLPWLVRATGIGPSTLQTRIAEHLAAHKRTTPGPWLTPEQQLRVETLLNRPNAYFAVRQALAQGLVTRGQVQMVQALRGRTNFQQKVVKTVNLGKSWSQREDGILTHELRAGHSAQTAAEELGRTIAGVQARAHKLQLVEQPQDWL